MSTPTKKETNMTSKRLFERVSFAPIYSPIGVIEVSAPSVKKPIPTVIITAPMIKQRSIEDGTGKNVASSTSTIRVTGSTEDRDSFIFSDKTVLLKIFTALLLSQGLYYNDSTTGENLQQSRCKIF